MCNPAIQVWSRGAAELLLGALERNGRLIHLWFDMDASDQDTRLRLWRLLERNLKARRRAENAALCLIACHKYRRRQCALGKLHHDTVAVIARMVWSTRHDPEWFYFEQVDLPGTGFSAKKLCLHYDE